MKFTEMPYERPDFEALKVNIDEIIEKINNANNADEQISLVKEFEKTMKHYNTLSSICYVRNTIDTTDKYYDDERKFFDNASPILEEKYNNFYKALLNSKFRPELEKVLGEVVYKNMDMQFMAFKPEIIPLMQEENALCSDYQKLYASAKILFNDGVYTIAQLGKFKQSDDRNIRRDAFYAEGNFFDEHRAEFDEIYDKLVKNRTEQARKLGFDNFVKLGYIRQQRNCYGPEGVANFRRQVIEDLVPLVQKVKAHQSERINIKNLKLYDDTYHFSDGNPTPKGTPEELLAAAKKMYSEMNPQTKEFIEMMFDMDLFDVVAKDGKAPGGYCTSFPEYGCPFIFSNFNGTDGDVDVLTHEAGHAFADYTANKYIEFECQKSPSMEGCETHSMSMEFLTSPWHKLFFKEQTSKYELSHAEGTLSFIPYGTEVDNFQELVYLNPDWTPEQRNEAWAKLDKTFRPWIDFQDMPFYGRGAGWQRQLHIYLYPFYYLDYCLAQTVALQIFALMLKDEKNAWNTYYNFVKLGGTKFFVDLVKSVGLVSPIDNGCLKSTCETIEKWLQTKY